MFSKFHIFYCILSMFSFIIDVFNRYFACQIHDCQLLGFDYNWPTILYIYKQESQIIIGTISFDGSKKNEKTVENFPVKSVYLLTMFDLNKFLND